MTETNDLVADRGKTHGSWFEQSALQNLIKADMHSGPRWHLLSASQKEALDMIAVKVSRIVSGNPAEPDHWDDIMGYALLGKTGGHPPEKSSSPAGAHRIGYARAEGDTFEAMVDHVRRTALYTEGDCILVWVNEGDFWLNAPLDLGLAAIHAEEDSNGQPHSSVKPGQEGRK